MTNDEENTGSLRQSDHVWARATRAQRWAALRPSCGAWAPEFGGADLQRKSAHGGLRYSRQEIRPG